MADKAVIELGLRMTRLLQSEDFAPLLAELEDRIISWNRQLRSCATIIATHPHIMSHAANRLDELESLKEWIDDAIERGGNEKYKQDVIEAKEAESTNV